MNEVQSKILRDKLHRAQLPSTHGQSNLPTEPEAMHNPQVLSRAVKDLQWVVDGVIGDALAVTKKHQEKIDRIDTITSGLVLGLIMGVTVNCMGITGLIIMMFRWWLWQ